MVKDDHSNFNYSIRQPFQKLQKDWTELFGDDTSRQGKQLSNQSNRFQASFQVVSLYMLIVRIMYSSIPYIRKDESEQQKDKIFKRNRQ